MKMRITKRGLGVLAALALVVTVLLGFGTAASGANKPKVKGPDRRPPIVLPQEAQDALNRGELAKLPTDFEALADQLGLTGEAKKGFVERSKMVAEQTPVTGDGPGPSKDRAPTKKP